MNYLELLSGGSETFITEVWSRRILVHQADPDVAASIFGIDHADELITQSALRTPQVRLAQDGKVIDEARYTRKATLAGKPMTGLLDARKVLGLFDGGATIIFQGLQRYWEPLRQLVRSLEADLGHPCQANAYLTPPGSQGFALHSDTHDVFTLQTFGSKQWEVHDDGVPQQVMMTPGTSMYLPTGTPHMARTQATASLHITIGINQVVWSDVLRDVVGRVLADGGFGEHLPAGMFRDPDALAAALRERLSALGDALTSVDADAEVARLERGFATARQPLLAGGLRDLLDVRDLTPTTVVRRRPGSQCTLKPSETDLVLLLGDRKLTVPARVEASVRALLDAGEVAAGAVPGLSEASSLVLVRRLVREGLLEVVR